MLGNLIVLILGGVLFLLTSIDKDVENEVLMLLSLVFGLTFYGFEALLEALQGSAASSTKELKKPRTKDDEAPLTLSTMSSRGFFPDYLTQV